MHLNLLTEIDSDRIFLQENLFTMMHYGTFVMFVLSHTHNTLWRSLCVQVQLKQCSSISICYIKLNINF